MPCECATAAEAATAPFRGSGDGSGSSPGDVGQLRPRQPPSSSDRSRGGSRTELGLPSTDSEGGKDSPLSDCSPHHPKLPTTVISGGMSESDGKTSRRTMPAPAVDIPMIDNSRNVYIPAKLSSCGVTVLCRTDVPMLCPSFLPCLESDIRGALAVLPRSVHGLVRRTWIWVNASYQYGPVNDPVVVRHSTVHHEEGWLIWNRDVPEKAPGGIEIYDASHYLRMRRHWNGCGLILHELCHVIHQFVLPDGLDNVVVLRTYHGVRARSRHHSSRAADGGWHRRVLRRDWAERGVDRDVPYALVNHREFFAELSVAFLCRDTGYTRLDDVNGTEDMSECSPPFLPVAPSECLPNELATGRKMTNAATRCPLGWDGGKECESLLRRPDHAAGDDGGGVVNHVNQGINLGRGMVVKQAPSFWRCCLRGKFATLLAPLHSVQAQSLPHCNKFFPFTNGQLRKFDPIVYAMFANLWDAISQWEDDDIDSCPDDGNGCLRWCGYTRGT